MFYDAAEEEIIVSNKNYAYSYVFDLREKHWHKITDSFRGEQGGRYALRQTIASQVPALTASARINIPALVISEQAIFTAQNRAIFTSANTVIASGQRLQLVINSSALSSYATSTATPLYMIVELMLLSIPFATAAYNSDNNTLAIYTDKSDYNNVTISIVNKNTNVVISEILAAFSQSVTIPAKGIGQIISATIDGITASVIITAVDSYTSLAEKLSNAIAIAINTISATYYLNTITLTTKESGELQNNTTISTSSSIHAILNSSQFTGGRDAGVINLSNSPVDVVDLTRRDTSDSIIVHLQSRPLQLGKFGYKKLQRAILRGRIIPSSGIFGAYLFGSNDLSTWKLLTGMQTNSYLDQLRMQRAKLSYKYYIVVAGGPVDAKSEISLIDIEVADMIDNKIR